MATGLGTGVAAADGGGLRRGRPSRIRVLGTLFGDWGHRSLPITKSKPTSGPARTAKFRNFGHVGRIVAGSATGLGAEPIPGPDEEPGGEEHGKSEEDGESEGPPPRVPTGTAATVFNDRSLQPECIIREGAVSWEQIDDENKQLLL